MNPEHKTPDEPSNLPDLLAGREGAKASAVERIPFFIDNVAKMVEMYRDSSKYDKGQLTEEDFQGIIGMVKNFAETTAALEQGMYEKDAVKIVNPNRAGPLQDKHTPKLTDKIDLKGINPNQPEKNVEVMGVIHEIANFENDVYDHLMTKVLQEKNIQSLETAGTEQANLIKNEVDKEMEQVVHNIGLNYLRGYIPGPIGKYFRNKASGMLKEISP